MPRSIEWLESEDGQVQGIRLEASIGTCDFSEVFSALKSFHDDNGLSECCLTVRDYEPEEVREDGHAAIEEAFAKAEAMRAAEGKKPGRAPKTRPVDPETGSAWVTSFHWNAHKPDDAKRIDYMFYDDGWPGRITFSKTPDGHVPTKVEASFHICEKDLAARFRELVGNL